MSGISVAITILFAVICVIAIVWWKQGLMPWWFAALVPFATLIGLIQHRPERMMAGALVMAGIGNLSWPYRGIRYFERQSNGRSAALARFFGSPIGGILYRLSGLGAFVVAIGMWNAPATSYETPVSPQSSYPTEYRRLMENYTNGT